MNASPPENVGKYQILEELGKGSTGVTYLAIDPFQQRKVAVKLGHYDALIDPDRGPRYRKMFMTEAGLVGKLLHPHIVEVYDAVIEAGLCYIVMEYIPGGTLERYCLHENLLSPVDVVEVIFKCCHALDFAHRMGLIHRDIKPGNILVVEGTDVKISDFGASFSFRSMDTQVTGLVGSPAYMSPEQVRERPLSQQSDIFSLGVVMYQLLTGRLPFEAENDYIMIYKINNEPAPAMSEIREGVPEVLEQIVAKAMAKALDERYQSWSEFVLDLSRSFQHLQQPDDLIQDTEKFNRLRQLSFFESFSEAELWEVLRISSWRKLTAGTVLIKEGDTGVSFFILAEGEATVTKGSKLLDLLRVGECFGEMAYLTASHPQRTASVTAMSDVKIIKIRPGMLKKATESLQLKFNQAFLKILVARLIQADARIAGM